MIHIHITSNNVLYTYNFKQCFIYGPSAKARLQKWKFDLTFAACTLHTPKAFFARDDAAWALERGLPLARSLAPIKDRKLSPKLYWTSFEQMYNDLVANLIYSLRRRLETKLYYPERGCQNLISFATPLEKSLDFALAPVEGLLGGQVTKVVQRVCEDRSSWGKTWS